MNEIIPYTSSSNDISSNNNENSEDPEMNIQDMLKLVNDNKSMSSSSSSDPNSNKQSPYMSSRGKSTLKNNYLSRFSCFGKSRNIFSSIKKNSTIHSHLGMRYYDPKTYELYPELLIYKKESLTKLVKLKAKYINIITYIDFVIATLDIISFILFCVFLNKQVNLSNFEEEELKSNTQIKYGEVLSFFSIVIILIRKAIDRKLQRLTYLFNIMTYFNKDYQVLKIILEVIVHFLMPYSFFSNIKWKFSVNEDEFYLYLNYFLFFFSQFRLYTTLRFIKRFSVYDTVRARRLLTYFGISNQYSFIYRAIVRSNSMLFFLFVFLYLMICGAALINFSEKSVVLTQYTSESVEYFSKYFNCMWTLTFSMITISFGNNKLINPVSKFFIGLLSLIGLFMATLIVLRIIIFLKLDPEELKCYKIIELIRNKAKNGFITKYINKYVKYKMSKFKKTMSVLGLTKRKNKFLIYKNKNYLKVREALTEKFEVEDLSRAFHTKEKKVFFENSNFVNQLSIMEEQVHDLLSSNTKTNVQSKKITTKFNKIVNLGKLIASVDSFTHLDGVDSLKGKHIIKTRDIKRSVREFQVKYKNRNPKGNDIIMQNALYQNEESTDENLSDFKSLNSSYREE